MIYLSSGFISSPLPLQLPRTTILYETWFYHPAPVTLELPSEQKVRERARLALERNAGSSDIGIIDIEHWKIAYQSDATIAEEAS